MLNFILKSCCRNLFKIGLSFYRTARLHTRQSWLKTGLLPTAVNSLLKINGLRTRLTSTLWTTISGELCLNATSHFNPSRRTSMSSRKFRSWYGTSCHKTRSIKPYWASRKDFGLVWKLPVDTSNTLKWTTCEILVFVITVNVSWQWKLQIAVDIPCKIKKWHWIFIQP